MTKLQKIQEANKKHQKEMMRLEYEKRNNKKSTELTSHQKLHSDNILIKEEEKLRIKKEAKIKEQHSINYIKNMLTLNNIKY